MEKKRAKRMDPAERRVQIMDAAVELIVANGHSSCTLEQVAQAAGISKPLIYKYFPNRENLLEALLIREFSELNGRGLDTIPEDIPIERVIHRTVERTLHYYQDRGPILRLLSSDPVVAKLARESNRSSRKDTADYFIRRVTEYYGLPRDVAVIAVTMAINAPIYSMAYLRRRKIDLEQTIEVWSEFIVGGYQALEMKYRANKNCRQ